MDCHPVIKHIIHQIWPHALSALQHKMLKRVVKTGITITCLAVTPPALKVAYDHIPQTTQVPIEHLIVTPPPQDRRNIPEPASWVLFSSAVLAVVVARRR